MENRKYEMTNITMEFEGRTLYRIRALKDFSNVEKGELGGWIQTEDNLSQEGDCWIYNNAKCIDNARMYDNSCMYDNSEMRGNSKMHNYSEMHDNSRMCGSSEIRESSTMFATTVRNSDSSIHTRGTI